MTAELESKTIGRVPAPLKKEEKVPKLRTPFKVYMEYGMFFVGMLALTLMGIYIWVSSF